MERRRAEKAGMTLEEYREMQRRRPRMIDLEVEEIEDELERPVIADNFEDLDVKPISKKELRRLRRGE